jgi:hypothetical protein
VAAAEDVADAVVSVVAALGLTPAPAVKSRKRPAVTAADGDSVVVVSVTDPEEVEQLTATRVLVTYPVGLVLAVKTGDVLGGTAALRGWREAVRKALDGVGLGDLEGAGAVDPRPGPAFDPGALLTGWSWSVMGFAVEVIEDRN